MNWIEKNLGELCDIKLGKTPSRNNKSYWDESKSTSNIWVSIADLSKLTGRYIADSKEYISDKGAELFKPVNSGTLLMSFKLSIGKLAFTDCDLYTNEAIVALPIKNPKEISNNYLYYYLQFYDWDKETENDVKLKGKTLNKAKLNLIKVPLPSLEMQEKIVKKLDVIFSEITNAISASESNYENSIALFQSYLNEIFSSNINLTKLKDCCVIKPPKSEVKNISNSTKVSFMPMEALGIDEKLAIPNQTRELKDVTGSYTYFAEGDVLLAKITPCFENGKLGIATNLTNGIGFGSSEYVVFRPHIQLTNLWLYYFLNRKAIRLEGEKNMSGAVGHKRITKEFIENLEIPLISKEEQIKHINAIEDLYSKTLLLKRTCEKKLHLLKALKQSILKQAFNGELVKE